MIGAALNMTDAFQVSSMTASFANGIMTVASHQGLPPWNYAPNGITIGDLMVGPGIPPGTIVKQYLSGANPGAGTWRVSNAFTRASQAGVIVTRNSCDWDAQTHQFRISLAPGWQYNPQGGSISHLTGWYGNLVGTIGLNQGSGARLNPMGMGPGGFPFTTTAGYMASILKVTQNWATFAITWDPDNATTGNTGQTAILRLGQTPLRTTTCICCWDDDITPTLSANEPDSLGRILNTSLSSGTAPIYSPSITNGRNLAMFTMGTIAAIDFNRLNGRKTIAFRGQTGITPDVISGVIAANLEANFYNYYGIWTTANDQFRFMYPGTVSGPYKWIDSYINQIWMNNALPAGA